MWVAKEFIEEVWPIVHADIKAAVERSGNYYLPEDIKAGCQDGRYQLWIVADDDTDLAAVVVTTITETRRKACQILVATGRGREHWQEMITVIEQWAKQNGCDVMKPIARPGWERVLKPMGYRATHTVLEKDL